MMVFRPRRSENQPVKGMKMVRDTEKEEKKMPSQIPEAPRPLA
jgi:hypothetical protein